jgi:hypothetical protein
MRDDMRCQRGVLQGLQLECDLIEWQSQNQCATTHTCPALCQCAPGQSCMLARFSQTLKAFDNSHDRGGSTSAVCMLVWAHRISTVCPKVASCASSDECRWVGLHALGIEWVSSRSSGIVQQRGRQRWRKPRIKESCQLCSAHTTGSFVSERGAGAVWNPGGIGSWRGLSSRGCRPKPTQPRPQAGGFTAAWPQKGPPASISTR